MKILKKIIDLFRPKKIDEELLAIAGNSLKSLLKHKGFEDVLNGLDEIIYISSFEGYVLWANKHTQELFGHDYKGKKCYSYLQHLDSKCDFCTNNKIKELGLYNPYKWYFTNEISKEDYFIIDMMIEWNHSGNVRFELAIKISKELQKWMKTQKNK